MKRRYEEMTQYPVSKVLLAVFFFSLFLFFFNCGAGQVDLCKIRGGREGITTERKRSSSVVTGSGVFPEADNPLLYTSPNAIRKESRYPPQRTHWKLISQHRPITIRREARSRSDV